LGEKKNSEHDIVAQPAGIVVGVRSVQHGREISFAKNLGRYAQEQIDPRQAIENFGN
jgi:hypothetical protein